MKELGMFILENKTLRGEITTCLQVQVHEGRVLFDELDFLL